MAEAAIQAGCDAYFGYPITPQAELLEWMARRMPELGRVFVQAERARRDQHGPRRGRDRRPRPGLVLEPGHQPHGRGDELHGRLELPMVLINVMRGGPGLGSIGPSQSDYFQATKGHGHGDYRVPVLAPSSIAEAVELVADAFELAERYRTPVMILADGVIGQAMEPVVPTYRTPPPGRGGWELSGADGRPPRVVRSLNLEPEDLEKHNQRLRRSSPRSPSGSPLGHGGSRRRRDRDRRLRDGCPGRPHGDRASPRARSARRPVPADHPVAVPVARPVRHRAESPCDRRRRAVGWATGRGRSTGGRGSHAGLLPWPDRWHGADARRGRRRGAACGG